MFMSSGVICVVLAVGLDLSDPVFVLYVAVSEAVSTPDNLDVEVVAISV